MLFYNKCIFLLFYGQKWVLNILQFRIKCFIQFGQGMFGRVKEDYVQELIYKYNQFFFFIGLDLKLWFLKLRLIYLLNLIVVICLII